MFCTDSIWVSNRPIVLSLAAFLTSIFFPVILRTDGFVPVHADYGGGEFLTKPLIFKGSNLHLNLATSATGSIRLELQDTRGRPLPGFSLQDSPLIWADEIHHTVVCKRTHAGAISGELLDRIAGKPVRLRCLMKDADLYSLSFDQGAAQGKAQK